jgi:hypothetical protein
MKTCFLVLLLCTSAPVVAEKTTWTPVSTETRETRQIMDHIMQINEYFAGIGAKRSSAREGMIFQYLKNLGTPVAFKVLKQLVEQGQLPKHFLNMA